jgi:tetratricopeptide (TPR) repeat protein
VFVVLVPVVLVGGVFLYASLAAKKRPLNPHWFGTALVVACAVSGGVSLLVAFAGVRVAVAELAWGLVFLGMAVFLAFAFHIFSRFWYELSTGNHLANLQRYAEAEGYLQRAWSRAQKYSARDWRRGSALLALGDMYRVQFLFGKAEEYFQLALPILQEHEKRHFLQLGTAYNNLGTLYCDLGKYVQAEIYFRQAQSVFAERGNVQGWVLAMTEHNIAVALIELEDYAQAEELLRSAQTKARGTVEVWLMVLTSLAKVHLRTDSLAEAEACTGEALSELHKSSHVSEPTLRSVLGSAAEVNRRLGKLDEAEQLAAEALELTEKSENKSPSSRFRALTNMAAVHAARDRLTDAERLFRQAVALHDERQLPNNLDWAESLEQFADLLRRMGREAEATTRHSQAQEVRRHWREYQAAPRYKEERIKAQS